MAAIIAACTEATAPPPASLRVASTRAANAKGDDNRIINDVHAIHVRISSMVFGVPTVDEYTFHVQQHGREVKGKFFMYQLRIIGGVEEAVVIASGPMVCAHVDGNTARVGGIVDQTTFPVGIPVGYEFTWSVTDNGRSAKADDFASQPLGNDAQAYCELGEPYPEHPVERGKIQIKG